MVVVGAIMARSTEVAVGSMEVIVERGFRASREVFVQKGHRRGGAGWRGAGGLGSPQSARLFERRWMVRVRVKKH